MRRRWRLGSISGRMLAMQLAGILIATGAALGIFAWDAHVRASAEAETQSLEVASLIAHNPFVVESLALPDPVAALQPYAVDLTADAHVDFITIMQVDGTRLTHPDASQIGRVYIGTIAPAQAGETFTETYTGTLGPSVRTITPILDDGRIVALVAAGITMQSVDRTFLSGLGLVVAAGALLALLGVVSSWWLSRTLHRATAGLGPDELRTVMTYYEASLHAVGEGLVLVDDRGMLVLANDEAATLMGLEPGSVPRPVDELPVSAELRALLRSDEPVHDVVFLTDDRALVVTHQPAFAMTDASRRGARGGDAVGMPIGTVTTLRDRTEILAIAGELEATRTLADAMQAQSHEHANRLHAITALLEMGEADEALRFASDDLQVTQRLADRVISSDGHAVVAALLLGKAAQARERQVALSVETHLDPGTQGLDATDFVTILGNLVDNAVDAAAGGDDPWVEVYLGRSDDGSELVIQISDSGPGIPTDQVALAFTRGFSTKDAGPFGRGLGLGLVKQTVARLGGTVEASTHVGAVMTVTVPLPDSAPAPEAS